MGVTLDAGVTHFPGSGQLRAELGEQFGPPVPTGPPPPGVTVGGAIAAYGRALGDDPWLESWPVTLRDVIPVPSADGWQLVDAQGDDALPVAAAALSRPALWKLVALSGGGPVTVFGECGHRGFDPLAAWSPGSEGGREGRGGATSADPSSRNRPDAVVPAAETVPLI